ncbi:MAG: hypothetical protein Ct9H300mP19_10500 [Dehalococcoidia bacterium]|nr:MAG: hypothetical protein Ct9H300mP19_10500 [Dehalococcoidia bacterium]
MQVLLQNVNPPLEVQSGFEDVVRAREDKDRLINLAGLIKRERFLKRQVMLRKLLNLQKDLNKAYRTSAG